MLKSELKAYVSVIKGLAKNRTPFKQIAIRDNTIQSTNLENVFTFKTDISGSGVYNPKALDIYLLDTAADLSAYREQELDDWVELPEIKWGAKINLATRHSVQSRTLTLGELLIYAMGFCSNDNMRPALTAVWIKDGEVQATDGYRAFTTGKLGELDGLLCNISPALIKAYKKLAKYGNWKLVLGEDKNQNQVVKLENENIALMGRQVEAQFPDLRKLVNSNRHHTHRVIIPFDKVKAIQDKENDDLNIKSDGTMTLNSRPLPFKAEIVKAEYDFDEDVARGVLMGRNIENDETILSVSVRLLADFKDDHGQMQLRIELPEIPQPTRNLVYSVL